MTELSIVLPIYNVEKYLDKCIDSILKNEVKNMEIILVDDGSTDNSGILCDEWAKRDERIKIFHIKNGGLMAAWKYGVNHSNGEYIGFVDADDWIDSDMFTTMLSRAKEKDVDIVSLGIVFEYSTSQKLSTSQFIGLYNFERIKQEIYPDMIYNPKTHCRGVIPSRVAKMFRRELLLKIINDCPDEISLGEDLLMTFLSIKNAKSIYFIPNFYPYHYRIHDSSMIRNFSFKKSEQLKLLRDALNSLKSTEDFDFSSQIDLDYINLFLMNLEKIMLEDSLKKREKVNLMRKFYNDIYFQGVLIKCERRYLSKKNKLYIFFLKHKLEKLLIFCRKVKSKKTK